MPIHREGYSTLLGIGIALLAVNGVAILVLPYSLLPILVGTSVLIFAFFAHFFRNPPRVIPDCKQCVIAPADGTIVAIEQLLENEYFHDQRQKLSIYMSALNVHVNRVPIAGTVCYTRYHPGRYLVAFHPKASELNERTTIVITGSDDQQILIRQIAGIIARRIRCYLAESQVVDAGDELGFIKFGSRCDVFLPLNAHISVGMGEKVRGGETILAKLESGL